MRNIFISMITAVFLTGNVAHATASYITPSPEVDLENYMVFWFASSICTGFEINPKQTFDQILILGAAFGLTEIETRRKISITAEKSSKTYQEDPYDYCQAVRTKFRSYDPEHLLKTGVTEGL